MQRSMKFLAWLACALVGLVAIPVAAQPGHAAPEADNQTVWEEQDLGRPISGVATGSSGYTTDGSGREIAVVTAGGQPSVFSAVDVETGEQLMRAEIPANGAQVWQYVTMPDRSIYFGTTKIGGVFRFDPDSMELTQIDETPFGQPTIFAAAADDDGTIFFGTYPDSKVLSYNTVTGEWRDYGPVLAGEDYVRSMDVDGDYVYVGTGTSSRLARIEIVTGDVTEIPLPSEYANGTFVYGVSVREGLLFAVTRPANVMLVYSLDDEEWVDEIPNSVSHGVSPAFSSQESAGPLEGVDTASSGYTENASGDSMAIIADRGDPTVVRVVDVESGTQLISETIPRRGSQVWGYATAPDRRVYFGATGSGEVYRFDPDSLELETIAEMPFEQTHFFAAAADSDGRITFGTYPDGKVISYDPSNDQWRDYGTVVAGADYVRSLDVADGYVYAGTMGDARLMKLDLSSGDKVEIPLPVEYKDGTSVNAVSVRGEYVFVRSSPANVVLVYSLTEERWVDEVPNMIGYDISPIVTTVDTGEEREEVVLSSEGGEFVAYDLQSQDRRVISLSAPGAARGWGTYDLSLAGFPGSSIVTADGDGTFRAWSPQTGATETFEVRSGSGQVRTEVLLSLLGPEVVAYDLNTRERRVISMSVSGAARGWGLQEFSREDLPGESLVMARVNGTFLVWNPQTDVSETFRPDVARGEYFIRSMAAGPDGNAWVGGYIQGIGLADADTGDTRMFTASGQPESMTAHGDYMVYGTYGGGQLWSYDSTQSWAYGTNPGSGVTIGHEQDRPVTMTSAGDVVAVGSVPYYGELGGALSLYDPTTGDLEVFRNVVQDQSVLSLAYRDGLIYGGTGIWGGLGVEPTTDDGHLFIFDPETDEVIYSGVPVPGAGNVSALTFDDDGNLWGLTYGELFKFDPDSREVVHIETYMEGDSDNPYWTGRELFWNDGKLVGSTMLGWGSGERIFEIEPESLEMTVLVSDAINLAIDRNGSYYYSRGANLYRLVESDVDPVDGPQVSVTPAELSESRVADAGVTIVGTGFGPDSPVDLSVDGEDLGSAVADGDGAVEFTYAAELTAGEYVVALTAGVGGAQTVLTVTADADPDPDLQIPAEAPEEDALTPSSEGGISVPPIVDQGATIPVQIGSERAGERVGVWIFSDSVYLGAQTVGTDGSVVVTLPETFVGDHRIAVFAEDETVIGWAEIEILATGGGDPSSSEADGGGTEEPLPETGLDAGWPVLMALTACALGGVLLLLRRRALVHRTSRTPN
ncbi:LPXTG cell wall anchor domain-containing protein [Ruania alkalisoli]|uniref:LPXTG cell wall anchor domain-containing protein n=1 Tax=Ruania alkalisoli TaxID=2779775 RepID=A0A7M1SU81_9MICO|nr:LPXTG cell wall anchor domain-containing protein [Ruania alkalisoli]QOR71136.1 LPXTG cell wall anchor domain-containing protein [Ruania alkalisoli]